MKKFFILLSVILCTVFVGCSKDSDNSSSSNSAIVGTWSWVDFEGHYNTMTFNNDCTFKDEYGLINTSQYYVDSGTYKYNPPYLTLFYLEEGESYTMQVTISGDTMNLDGMTFYRQ